MDRTLIIMVIAAYASGSIPFGVLFARARGVDIQKEGSGNIGATNVARVLGKKLGAVVLLLDAAKGALPVGVALLLAVPTLHAVVAGLAAVAGHCFPVWLRFRGGKGVATALGAFLVLDAPASGASVVVFGLAYAATRISSVGSLLGAAAFPVVYYLRGHTMVEVYFAIGVVALIAIQHRDNFRRLWRGEENRV